MSAHKNVEYVLNKFALDLKTHPPEFNAGGRCQINVGKILLFLDAPPLEKDYILSSPVFEGIPSAEILETALAGNLYWIETHGGTLMWEPKTQKLLLSYRGISDTLDLATFNNILKNFVYTATYWMAHLKTVEQYGKVLLKEKMKEKAEKGEKV